MSMDRFYRYGRPMHFEMFPRQTQFKEISRCVVRKDHSCGKLLGASKSCFIACPSTEEVETILALITEKLTKIGIDTVIAIKERAYGQDIFCTKICGKIIESQFCLVILDDSIELINGNKVNIPNSNVYYEYGLMTALGKYVIPLQKEGQILAFNIQTHDTIKYTPRNLSSELDRAFKDAAKMTQEDMSGYEHAETISERLFIRSLEINGYKGKDSEWFLSDDLDDTVFTAYVNPERWECLLFTVTNDKESLQNTLTDIPVITKRLESRLNELSDKIVKQSEEIDKLSQEAEELEKQVEGKARGIFGAKSQLSRTTDKINRLSKEKDGNIQKIELIHNVKLGVILGSDITELKEKAIAQYEAIDKKALSIPLYIGDITGIQIEDITIPFKAPTL